MSRSLFVLCAAVFHMDPGHGIERRLFFGEGEVVSVALDVLKRLPVKDPEDSPVLVGDDVVVVSHQLSPL